MNRTKIDQFHSNEANILERFHSVGRYSEAKFIDNHVHVHDYSNLPATQILSKVLTQDEPEDGNDVNIRDTFFSVISESDLVGN